MVEPNFRPEKTVRCVRCHEWVPAGTTVPVGIGHRCRDLCYSTSAGKPRSPAPAPAAVRAQNARAASGRPRSGTLSRFRKRVRARDGEMCRFCGRRTNLQVHHIILRSQGGPDEDWNGITLCGNDHDRVHRKTRYWQGFLLQTVRITPSEFLTVPEVEQRYPGLTRDEIPAYSRWEAGRRLARTAGGV